MGKATTCIKNILLGVGIVLALGIVIVYGIVTTYNNKFYNFVIENVIENKLIEHNLRLVAHIVKKYEDKKSIKIEDIYNEAYACVVELESEVKDLLLLLKKNVKSNIDSLTLNSDNSNTVKILNIHKSKGLEYSICYFSGLSKRSNDSL